MENAKIGVIEDTEPVARLTINHLKSLGHEIVFHATTREEALKALDQIEDGEIEVNVYLVDGKLSESSSIGEDGAVISGEIERRGLGGLVIGFSSDVLTRGIYHHQADGKNLDKVEQIIEELPNPTEDHAPGS